VNLHWFYYSYCGWLQREQLQQQEALVSSLQQQLAKVSKSQESRQPLSHDMDGFLARECCSLKDRNESLEEELRKSSSTRKKFEEVILNKFFSLKYNLVTFH